LAASMLSVIIPANNEEFYIARCLDALIASEGNAHAAPHGPGQQTTTPVELIVVANACTDRTVDAARLRRANAELRGWSLKVLDLKEGGKLNALNVGDRHASGDVRIYIDADVVVSPSLLNQIGDALDRKDPAYASGRLVVSTAESWITRAYARFWCRLPFVTDGVPGCGVFAVNAAGRARWQEFPAIISDDTFVRLKFEPNERIGVPAPYEWPMVEGFRNLVRVRKRQDIGVQEIRERFPELMPNEGKSPLGISALLRLASVEFVGFCVYVAVTIAVRLSRLRGGGDWTRGR
jgi:glycosyltransferase involved in cell wall biosynthesis